MIYVIILYDYLQNCKAIIIEKIENHIKNVMF